MIERGRAPDSTALASTAPDATAPDSTDEVLPVAEAWELTAAGPQLAGLLAGVDRRALTSGQRLQLVVARNRLVSHLQAELLADIYATTWDEPPPADGPRWVHPDDGQFPETEAELAFALRWTRAATSRRLEHARQLAEDLPAVHTALTQGRIDMPKALLIGELAGWVDDVPTARRLVDQILEVAGRLTTGQLRARLRRLVLTIDPTAASRRVTRAVNAAGVEVFDNPDGSGEVWGRSLPPQEAAAAGERLTAIARAAKAAGDDRSLDQLRADALLDLLAGDGVAVGGGVGRHLAGLPDAGGPPEHEQLRPTPATSAEPAESQPATAAETASDTGPADPVSSPAPAGPGASAVRAVVTTREPAPPHQPPAGALPAPRRGIVDLQVPLLTLLRLADAPGEIGGFGPVVADIARQVADRQADGSWRFTVTDELGRVGWHGITRARPTAETAALVRARDRSCVAPGCRHPARTCDLDHTTAKADSGHSGPSNLAPLCRTHHRLKHSPGYRLERVGAGTYAWTTRRGLHYRRPAHQAHDPCAPEP